MMAEKLEARLEDSPRIRDVFTKCIAHLVEKTDFDVMYEELNNTDIGKRRMSYIFILRGGHSPRRERSQELYDGIYKENDKDFVQWFNEIKRSLSRTANKNNGKHQEILDMLLELLLRQDSPQDCYGMQLPKKVIKLKHRKEIKVILLGHSYSGKTRFFQYAIGHPVEETSTTIGTIVDFKSLEYQYEDTVVRLNLWDTAGQEKFNAITKSYYRNSNGALIFVDLCEFKKTDEREGIRLQTKNLIQYLQDRTKTKIPCLLIGTKWDLVEQLSNEEMKAFKDLADSCSGGKLMYTSAKTGYNVENALNLIVELVMDDMGHQENVEYNVDEGIIRLPDNPQPQRHGNNVKKKKSAKCRC